jgi:hypothetical protein
MRTMNYHSSDADEGRVAPAQANHETAHSPGDFPPDQEIDTQKPSYGDPSATGLLIPGNDKTEVKPKTTGIGSSLTDDERMKILAELCMQ